MFFFNIILPTRFFFQYFLFFLLLSFSLSLPFPLSFLPFLSSSFSHVQNPEAPEQELHQHHSHHNHHNASPIHRSSSTQKHHHKHSINTDLHQPIKLIFINTDLSQPITSTPSTPISINPSPISINTNLHQNRSPSTPIHINPSPISINTDPHHRSKSPLQSMIHNHRSPIQRFCSSG